MNDEADDLEFMRDVSEFFGAKASEDELKSLTQGRDSTDKVILKDGDAVLRVDETVFAKLYRHVWADVRNNHNDLSKLGVNYIAEAAEKLGLKELGERIRAFQKAMSRGLALIRREDGSLWAPKPISRVPARATAAEQEAVANDVSLFFGKDGE